MRVALVLTVVLVAACAAPAAAIATPGVLEDNLAPTGPRISNCVPGDRYHGSWVAIDYTPAAAVAVTAFRHHYIYNTAPLKNQLNFQLIRGADPGVGSLVATWSVAAAGNDRIQYFTPDGRFLGKWGSHGTGDGEFDGPRDVASRPPGSRVYVVDYSNNRIQYFNRNEPAVSPPSLGGVKTLFKGVYRKYLYENVRSTFQRKKEVATMAVKTFLVESYKVALGHAMSATWSGIKIKIRGYVACYGGDHRFIAYFLTDDSPVPDPVYIVNNKVGAIFLPFDEMGPFVDLVRNERPVFAYLSTDHPEWNNVKTSREPVGEEES